MGEAVPVVNKFPPNYRMRIIYCFLIIGNAGIRLISSISQYLYLKDQLRTGQITESELANAGVTLFFLPSLMIGLSMLFVIIIAANMADQQKETTTPQNQNLKNRKIEDISLKSTNRAFAIEPTSGLIFSNHLLEKKHRWLRIIHILLITFAVTVTFYSYSIYPIMELFPQLHWKIQMMIVNIIGHVLIIPVIIVSFIASRIKYNRLAISTGIYLMFSLIGVLRLYGGYDIINILFGLIPITEMFIKLILQTGLFYKVFLNHP